MEKLNENEIEEIAKDLSEEIMGHLMMKTINKNTYKNYKEDVYDIILGYLSDSDEEWEDDEDEDCD